MDVGGRSDCLYIETSDCRPIKSEIVKILLRNLYEGEFHGIIVDRI